MRSAARISSHPIHPMLVAFPIGLFVTGFVFDLIALAVSQPRLWAAGWYCIIGGLISGYGIARGLSRSLYRLSVRVQDLAEHLDQEVPAVRITAELVDTKRLHRPSLAPCDRRSLY